eukprot:GILK01006273.1.p1 GENE.GILK01006273.1~~GILK01006273.1.p1  ORF type:complete len:952 (-),score=178.29 GILK01006273.1:34-2889(-)
MGTRARTGAVGSDVNGGRKPPRSLRDNEDDPSEEFGPLVAALVDPRATDQLAPTIRTVLERQWETSFQKYIDEYIVKQDEAIRDICNYHYQEFIGSVDELLTVQSDAGQLRSAIVNLNKGVQNSGQVVLERGERLQNARTIRRNITNAHALIKQSRQAVGLLERAQTQMQRRKFVSALKTLEQLKQHPLYTHQEVALARYIAQQIPIFVDNVKVNVKKNLSNWLVEIRQSGKYVGEMAFEQTKQRLKLQRDSQTEPLDRLMQFTAAAGAAGAAGVAGGNNPAQSPVQTSNQLSARSGSPVPEAGSVSGSTVPSLQPQAGTRKLTRSRRGALEDNKNKMAPEEEEQGRPSLMQRKNSGWADQRMRSRVNDLRGGSISLSPGVQLKGTPQSSPNMSPTPGSTGLPSAQQDSMQYAVLERVRVDFSVVYQSLNIYERLGMAAEFKEYLTTNRQEQLTQALDLRQSYASIFVLKGIDTYEKSLAEIAGFFLVEEELSRHNDSMVSEVMVQALWERTSLSLERILKEQMNGINELELLKQFKELIVVFCETLSAFNYSVQIILGVVRGVQNRYRELLLQRSCQKIAGIISSDTFGPMVINNQQEYAENVRKWKFNIREVILDSEKSLNGSNDHTNKDQQQEEDDIVFPLYVPFSSQVPALSELVTTFVADALAFAKDVTMIDDHLWKSTDKLLFSVVQEVSAPLKISQTGLNQVAQVLVNVMYLHHTCNVVQSLLTGGISKQNMKRELSAKEAFLQVRGRCEDAIYEVLRSKIDDFISLAGGLSWTPNNINAYPHDFVSDLVIFFTTTMQSLRYLPANVVSASYFFGCKHASKAFIDTLTGPTVGRWNILAMYNLQLDIALLEDFADTCGISGLRECFLEARQLVDLIVGGEIEQILDPNIRQLHFSRVNLSKLLIILDKFREVGLFASASGIPKLKKTSVTLVCKKIKEYLKTQQ